MQSIINMYGLGAVSVQQVMGLIEEALCDIIDVEYEDLSDELEKNRQLPNLKSAERLIRDQSDSDIDFMFPSKFVKLKLNDEN